MARTCAQIADQKMARDIVILEVGELLRLTDCFVIATGENAIQLRAIADDIDRQLRRRGVANKSITGYEDAHWILMDFIDIVVHLFQPETRKYYDLELLWGDAPRIPFEPAKARPPRAH